jgi:hypothetical protein
VWRDAWFEVFETAHRQRRRLEPYLEVFAIADWLRRRHQFVLAARRLADALGEESPRAWRILAFAARISTEAAAIEAELDAVMRHVA